MLLTRIRHLSVAMLLSSCGGEPDGSDAVATERTSVLDGVPSPSSEDAVVQVHVSGGYWCSGTLLAPNVVLTSLHCVTSQDSALIPAHCNPDGTHPPDDRWGRIGATLPPNIVEVYFGTKSGFGNDDVEPAAFGAEIFGSGSTTLCADNIAAVILDRDLPARGFPVRVSRPTLVGERLTLIGYEYIASPVRTRLPGVPVLAVGPDDLSAGPGEIVPRTFLVGDGPCEGDQGGPAISPETGAIVGLYSFTSTGVDHTCDRGLRSLYTKVSPYADFLERALESTGRTLLVESDPAGAEIATDSGGCSLARFRANEPEPLVMAAWATALLAALGRRRRSRLVCSKKRATPPA